MRCAHAWLDDTEAAPGLIDVRPSVYLHLEREALIIIESQTVLSKCLEQSLPIYLFVPLDFVHEPICGTRLDDPLVVEQPVIDSRLATMFKHMLGRIQAARNHVIIVDILVARHQATSELHALMEVLRCPVFATPMAKGIVDETCEQYLGIYGGNVSYPGIQEVVEGSNCVIHIGPLLADSNTGGLSRNIKEENLIMIEPFNCCVSLVFLSQNDD